MSEEKRRFAILRIQAALVQLTGRGAQELDRKILRLESESDQDKAVTGGFTLVAILDQIAAVDAAKGEPNA